MLGLIDIMKKYETHTHTQKSQPVKSVCIYKYDEVSFFPLCLHNKNLLISRKQTQILPGTINFSFFSNPTKVVIPAREVGWTDTGDAEALFLPSFM